MKKLALLLSAFFFALSCLSQSPNPASSEFTINSSNQIQSVEVFNLIGELIYSNNTPTNFHLFSLNDWILGVYFVELNFENGSRTAQKIIIR